MTDTKRHIVLPSLLCIIETLAVLVFPSHFYVVLAVSLAVSLLIFVACFCKRSYALAFLLSVLVLVPTFNSYRVYTKTERQANSFIAEYADSEAEFVAAVRESRHYGSYSILFADIHAIDNNKTDKAYKARIGSYTANSIQDGDIIIFKGKMQPLSQIETEDFDTRSYLRSKKTFIDIPSAEIVFSTAGKKPPLSEIRNLTRNVIYKSLAQNYNFDGASVAYAMFAGDKDYISDDVKESFKRSGLSHVLCVSGLHLTVIMGTLYALLSLFTFPKRVKCVSVIALGFIYCAFTGFSMSTFRAAIVCSITFFALMYGRKTDGYISLFAAIMIICIIFPYAVLDISLALSFSACLGILSFSEIRLRFKEKTRFHSLLLPVIDLVFAGFGAMLFTLPIISFSFGGISLVSVVSTLLVSPLCAFLLAALLLLLMLSPLGDLSFFEHFAGLIGIVCDRICFVIISVSRLFSRMKYAYVETDRNTSIVLLGIFAVILIAVSVFACFGLLRQRIIASTVMTAFCVVMAASSLVLAVHNDQKYRISYFRQNEDDRQLSIKLPQGSYLIVNADSSLCCDEKKTELDTVNKNNYLLLIPDNEVNVDVLVKDIEIFDNKAGIKGIFVPETYEGTLLAENMAKLGVECSYMPWSFTVGDTQVELFSGDYHRFVVTEPNTKTTVVFADSYSRDYFEGHSDICAFFTRKTKNQFDVQEDAPPDCDVFFTRMGKQDKAQGIENTYGAKSIVIKE